jgi:hypothetical protein
MGSSRYLPFHELSFTQCTSGTNVRCVDINIKSDFYLWVLHPVAHLSNWFFMTPSIATKFQYINSLLFPFHTHYMIRPLLAILRWDIQLDGWFIVPSTQLICVYLLLHVFILFHYMFRLLLSHLQVQFQSSVPRVRIIIVQCAFYNYTLISYMIQTPS